MTPLHKPRARPSRRRTLGGAALTPMDLVDAPELASLAVLDHVLHVARLALFAQHPLLLGNEHGLVDHEGDPLAELAERLLARAHALGGVLHAYRLAADHRDDPPDDELPF